MINQSNKFTSFLFYDYETFGTNPALDKPSQFACVRTDEYFHIISEPEIFYCYPPNDYLPSIESILITGITPQYTLLHGMNEFYFSKNIYDIFSISNTCIIGFNNIAFDDEITRNIFYRNFFDPYGWCYKGNNSRWDILNLLRACYVFRPENINWPVNNLGFVSFKLKDFTSENNIAHTHCHDALSDVYATLAVAKFIKYKQPNLFNFFFKYRNKKKLIKFINDLGSIPLIYVSSIFGASKNNIGCVIPIMWSPINSNVLIVFDLSKTVVDLLNNIDRIKKDCFTDLTQLFHYGIQLVNMNKLPIITPLSYITVKRFSDFHFNQTNINFNISYIMKYSTYLRKKIRVIFSQKNVFFNNTKNVDLQLYNNFINKHDSILGKKIRSMIGLKLNDFQCNFLDPRMNKIFFRFKARNFPDMLNTCEKRIWLKHCINVFNKDRIKKYFKKIEFYLHKNVNNDYYQDLLKKLLLYIKYILNIITSK